MMYCGYKQVTYCKILYPECVRQPSVRINTVMKQTKKQSMLSTWRWHWKWCRIWSTLCLPLYFRFSWSVINNFCTVKNRDEAKTARSMNGCGCGNNQVCHDDSSYTTLYDTAPSWISDDQSRTFSWAMNGNRKSRVTLSVSRTINRASFPYSASLIIIVVAIVFIFISCWCCCCRLIVRC